MRILLHKTSDKSYYAGAERWVTSADEALDFEVSARAAIFVKNKQLASVQIVFSYPDASHNMVIELQKNSDPDQQGWKAVEGSNQLSGLKYPEPYRDVIVFTKNSRCLGFVDDEGIWHGVREKLREEVIRWEAL